MVKRLVLAISAVGAIFVMLLVIMSNQSVRHAITLATTRQPEHFTELYFNNHQHLPAQLDVNVPTTFSYHVTNHEAGPVTYHAWISVVENGKVRLLSHDTFTLSDGAGNDHSVIFSEPLPHQNIQLIIDLPDQNQRIYFRSQT
jgi:hypothetical protein